MEDNSEDSSQPHPKGLGTTNTNPWPGRIDRARSLVALMDLVVRLDSPPAADTGATNLVHVVGHMVTKSVAALHEIVSELLA